MSIHFVESPDSRDLSFGAQDGGQTFRATVATDAGETELQIWMFALQNSVPYYNGFIRQKISVKSKGAPNLWAVEIEYGTTGLGGGDQPLGGTGSDGAPPDQPTAPESPTASLTSGWSFSIRAPRLHITESHETISMTLRNPLPGAAPNFRNKIGVDKDGKVVGVDWPPEPAFTFKRTVACATVTQAYLNTLSKIAGGVNKDPFYGWATGEVLFVSADGQFTQGEGWSVTFEFGVEKNRIAILITGGLSAPAKKGFEYMWVLDMEESDLASGLLVTVPRAVYVEQVLEPVDFSLIRIGE